MPKNNGKSKAAVQKIPPNTDHQIPTKSKSSDQVPRMARILKNHHNPSIVNMEETVAHKRKRPIDRESLLNVSSGSTSFTSNNLDSDNSNIVSPTDMHDSMLEDELFSYSEDDELLPTKKRDRSLAAVGDAKVQAMVVQTAKNLERFTRNYSPWTEGGKLSLLIVRQWKQMQENFESDVPLNKIIRSKLRSSVSNVRSHLFEKAKSHVTSLFDLGDLSEVEKKKKKFCTCLKTVDFAVILMVMRTVIIGLWQLKFRT